MSIAASGTAAKATRSGSSPPAAPAIGASHARRSPSPSTDVDRLRQRGESSTEMTCEVSSRFAERGNERHERRLSNADPSSSTYAHGDLDREARPVRRRRRSSSVEDQYATTTGTTAESERGARKWARRDELDVAPPGFRRSSGGSASMPDFAVEEQHQRRYSASLKREPAYEPQESAWQQSGRRLTLERESSNIERRPSIYTGTPPPMTHRTPSITGWSPPSADGSSGRRIKEERAAAGSDYGRSGHLANRRGSWTGSAPPHSAPVPGPYPVGYPPALGSAPPIGGGFHPAPGPPVPPGPPAAWSSHHPRPRQSVGSAANHLPTQQHGWSEHYRPPPAHMQQRPAPYARTPPPSGPFPPMPHAARPVARHQMTPVAGSAAAAYAPPMTSRPLAQSRPNAGPSRDASGSSTKSNAGTPGSSGPVRTTHAPKSQAVFVTKLYTMLEDPHIRASGLLRWSDDGMGFICADPTEFARTILPQFFKHNNWHSFVRQLNMYGFNKQVNDVFQTIHASPDTPIAWEFRHAIFQRDDPSSISRIKRRSVKTSALPPTSKSRDETQRDEAYKIRRYAPSAAPYVQNQGSMHPPESHARFGPRTHSPLPMSTDRQLPPLQTVAPASSFHPPPFAHEPLRPLQQLSASRALPVPVPAVPDLRRLDDSAVSYSSTPPPPRDEPDSASSGAPPHLPVEAIVHHAARIEEAAEDVLNETHALREEEPITRQKTWDLIESLRSATRNAADEPDDEEVDRKVAQIDLRLQEHDRRLSISANAAEQIQAAAHALQSTISAAVGGHGTSGRTSPSISEAYRRRSLAHSPTFAFSAHRTSFDTVPASRPSSRGFRGASDRRPASASAPKPIRVSPDPVRGRPSSSRSLGFVAARRGSLRDRPRTSPQDDRRRSSSPKSHLSEQSKAGSAIRDLLN